MLLVLLGVIVERAGAQTKTADSAAVVRSLDRYAEFLRSGPTDSVVGAYTEDGQLVLPGMAAVKGREAIRGFIAPLAAASTVESCSMTAETVELAGAAAYAWGDYQQRAGETGKPAGDYHGRFVAKLQRGSDGQWRIARLLMQPAPN